MQTEFDHQWLRRSFELAIEARQRVDHPFGAVLVAAGGELLAEGGNLVVSRGDFSAHAELALLQGPGWTLALRRWPAPACTQAANLVRCAPARRIGAGLAGLCSDCGSAGCMS